MNYKPKEFAEMIGVSVKTLQRWDRDGILKAYRTPKDRRYYTDKQYAEYTGKKELKSGKTVIYARVSGNNQKDDLNNQIEFLKQYANAKGIIVDEILEDIGSGLNYNRKKWNQLIDRCINGEITSVIIAHKDRFIRFGYEWFERFLQSNGTEITVVNNEKMSPEQELINDLISIIHVFSCRIYGLRKYKNKIKGTKKLLKSYKTEIFPTPEQKQIIHRTIGVCRFVYNFYHLLARRPPLLKWGMNCVLSALFTNKSNCSN